MFDDQFEDDDHDVMDEEIFADLKTPEERLRKQQEEDFDPYPERSLGLVPPDEEIHEFSEQDAGIQRVNRKSPGWLHSDDTVLPRTKMQRKTDYGRSLIRRPQILYITY